jgi:hypothetical protein
MRRILLVGIMLTLAACGRDDSMAPPPSTIAGLYQLTMVDGQGLPLTLLDLGAYQVQLTSGALNMRTDGKYSLEVGYRILDSGNERNETVRDAGEWNNVDQAITLASTGGGIPRAGTVSGDTITLQSSSRVLVLRK